MCISLNKIKSQYGNFRICYKKDSYFFNFKSIINFKEKLKFLKFQSNL